MNNEIEKPDAMNPDDVLAAIQSFNDPSIITNIFRELGWSYSLEIRETLIMAKQNANLSIKFKAIKHLRELLREAAETSGYTANVSQSFPNAQGGQTTFHAKRISNMLNPVKQIESTIKEPKNDKIEEAEPNRGSDRSESQTENGGTQNGVHRRNIPSEPIQDTGRAFPIGDVDSGGTEPPNGGETPRVPGGGNPTGTNNKDSDSQERNPCIKTRPPTCDRELFPGVSSAED